MGIIEGFAIEGFNGQILSGNTITERKGKVDNRTGKPGKTK